MPFVSTVLYPKEVSKTFKMDYYLSTHMPMVLSKLGQYGLESWSIVQFGPTPDGSEPPYCVQATLNWKDHESATTAFPSQEMKEILDDVPNFSNKGPLFLGGNVVGKS
jgi:uncharacterized protein (TIGR02118 family)